MASRTGADVQTASSPSGSAPPGDYKELARAPRGVPRLLAFLQATRAVVSATSRTKPMVDVRTGAGDESLVPIVRKERVRQRPEEVLHARSHGGEVVVLVRVLEVKVLPSLKARRDELGLSGTARLAVNAFVVHACESEVSPATSARCRWYEVAPYASTAPMHLETTTGT